MSQTVLIGAGLAVSTEDVDYVAKQLGLGEPTGSELPENTGMRANAETKAEVYAGSGMEAWVDGDKLQASRCQPVEDLSLFGQTER